MRIPSLFAVVGLGLFFWSDRAIQAAPPEEQRPAADNSARDLVQEALQREVYGLTAERAALLRSAVQDDATAPQPHWYLGEVRSTDGIWEPAGKARDPRAGQLVREYRVLRDSTADDAQDQNSLAEWCASRGLKQQARAHWLRSLGHNPQQAEVRQHLGLVRIGQQWYEPNAYERMQQRARALREATEHWQPLLMKLAPQLRSPNAERREAAVAEILAIKDPLSLPILQSIVGSQGEAEQELVLRLCGQMSDPLATELLAWHATENGLPRLRKLAGELLVPREMSDYAPLMISEMYTPVRSKVETRRIGPGGFYVRQSFWREAADHHEVVVSDSTFIPTLDPFAVQRFGLDMNLAINENRARYVASEAVAATEAAVDKQNRLTTERNDRIAEALGIATGQKFGPKPEAWWDWWMNYNEWTMPAGKGLTAAYRRDSYSVIGFSVPRPTSCLAAGTPIVTAQGLVNVERLEIGDLVLARDVETGELAYKPVLQTTVRPKRQLHRITAGKDTFEATGGHLFWVSGQGWTRARELKAGQILHGAGAPVRVLNVEDGIVTETHNLVVADFSNYFVGTEQILSHDNTPRRPTRVTVPGLEPQ
jgi:hypothetical protein